MPLPTRTLKTAELHIGDGWLALYRGRGWSSRWIQFGTGGPYSHAALLCRENGHVDVLELVARGGRRLPLEEHALRYPGQIDIFAPDTTRWPHYDGHAAVLRMRELTRKPYGFLGIVRLLLQKVPGLWRCWPLTTSDLMLARGAPFCSHAVCDACRSAGGVDPVPRKPDHLVTPNDLAWSHFWVPQFTLAGRPARTNPDSRWHFRRSPEDQP